MAVMPAQLPDRISAAGQSQEPPTATTFGSASQAAALASPIPPVGQTRMFGKRPRQRAQCLDTAGLLGREEFDEIEAMRQRLHQFGGRGDPRRERQVAGGGGFQQFRRGAGADAEFGADRLAPAPDRRRSGWCRSRRWPPALPLSWPSQPRRATGVRKVTSSTRTPPATSARASGTACSSRSMVSTGMTVADLNMAASFSCLACCGHGDALRMRVLDTARAASPRAG